MYKTQNYDETDVQKIDTLLYTLKEGRKFAIKLGDYLLNSLRNSYNDLNFKIYAEYDRNSKQCVLILSVFDPKSNEHTDWYTIYLVDAKWKYAPLGSSNHEFTYSNRDDLVNQIGDCIDENMGEI